MRHSYIITFFSIVLVTVMATTAVAGSGTSLRRSRSFSTPVAVVPADGMFGVVEQPDEFGFGIIPADDPLAVTVSCSNASDAKIPCSQFGDWIKACEEGLNGEGDCTTSGCTCKLPDKAESSDTTIGIFSHDTKKSLALKKSVQEDLYPPLPDGTDRLKWIQEMMSNAPASTEDVEAIDSEPQIMPQFIPATPYAYLFDNQVDDFMWNGPSFDYNVFAANIEAAMDGNALGYAYAINLLGQSAITGADGAAQTPVDGDIDQSSSKRMTVASISKTVTAVAVLQLLEKNGLTIDDQIDPWLPGDWTKGLNFQDLKFRHLLTHRSGYAGWGTGGSWASLQSMVASNQADSEAGFDYENNNFALFRVIIPALWIATLDSDNYSELNEGLAALMYIAYVQQYIFDPIGVNQAMCMNNGNSDPVLLYDVNNPNVAGWETGDYGLNCGAYGWNLSALDLANFMAHIRYNDDILSPANRNLMDEFFLGWMDPGDWSIDLVGDHGVYYAHGGDWVNGGRQFHGCVMKFPIHVEAVLLINSSENVPGYQCELLRQAFDDAYVY